MFWCQRVSTSFIQGHKHAFFGKINHIGNYTIIRKNQRESYNLVNGIVAFLPRNIPSSHIKVISEEQSELYNIEVVIDHKGIPGNLLYMVRWKGYDAKDGTWEPERHFHNNKTILKYWNSRNGQHNIKHNSSEKRQRKNHDNSIRKRAEN